MYIVMGLKILLRVVHTQPHMTVDTQKMSSYPVFQIKVYPVL